MYSSEWKRVISSAPQRGGRYPFVSEKLMHHTYVNVHLLEQTVIHQEVVRHADAMRLHHMALAVKVIADITYGHQ